MGVAGYARVDGLAQSTAGIHHEFPARLVVHKLAHHPIGLAIQELRLDTGIAQIPQRVGLAPADDGFMKSLRADA